MIDGKKYVFELPDINTVLLVVCKFAAINAADIQIVKEIVDGKINDEEGYYVSYQYSTFDGLNFRSFSYKDKCIIYTA